jgi:ketosteroid isomerase-like protein
MGQLDRVVREFFDALNTGDLDAVAAAIDPSCDFVAPGFSGRGPDAAVGWMRPFVDAFPGIHHSVLVTIEADDAVAFELEIAGTHSAPLVGPAGEIPPTGRDMRIFAANVWRVQDGRVVSYHVFFDQMAFMIQLGLVPDPSAHAS